MDAQKNDRETCPLCLQRRRRQNCMVCYVCDKKTMEPMQTANAEAIVNGRFEDVVDLFEFVITKGEKAIELNTKECQKIEEGLEAHKKKLWAEAERYVATMLSTSGKGGDHAVYLALKMNRYGTTVDKFRQLKKESTTLNSHYALGKIIDSLRKLVSELTKKRDQYLAGMNKKSGEETAVA